MRKNGFTLIELMVTISIIAVLAAIAMSTYSALQKNGRDAKRKSDLAVMQSALEQYHADQKYYPSSIVFGNDGNELKYNNKIYLTKIPTDSSYSYMALPSSCTNNCTSYSLCAKMENPANASTLTNCSTTMATYEVRPP